MRIWNKRVGKMEKFLLCRCCWMFYSKRKKLCLVIIGKDCVLDSLIGMIKNQTPAPDLYIGKSVRLHYNKSIK